MKLNAQKKFGAVIAATALVGCTLLTASPALANDVTTRHGAILNIKKVDAETGNSLVGAKLKICVPWDQSELQAGAHGVGESLQEYSNYLAGHIATLQAGVNPEELAEFTSLQAQLNAQIAKDGDVAPVSEGENACYTLTTRDDGFATIPVGLINSKPVTVTELTAPGGYELISEPITATPAAVGSTVGGIRMITHTWTTTNDHLTGATTLQKADLVADGGATYELTLSNDKAPVEPEIPEPKPEEPVVTAPEPQAPAAQTPAPATERPASLAKTGTPELSLGLGAFGITTAVLGGALLLRRPKLS